MGAKAVNVAVVILIVVPTPDARMREVESSERDSTVMEE